MRPEFIEWHLKYHQKSLGVLTYDECVAKAHSVEQTISDLPVGKPGLYELAKQCKKLWHYAEALSYVEALGRDDHLSRKEYLCSWRSRKDGVIIKEHHETIVFMIPRRMRMPREQREFMAEEICNLYRTFVSASDVEFMSLTQ
ncbi:hypothetical protein MZD04_gp162 [Pseudomonas phage Psa21]|uniref:Uncharacterized protein n=1 Tax=Pseudomonas phage Psa21 TaxID=2530023 RepID=A0A481W4F8_9CAUD|nr:hypothetical protein MZD04_gp162 [Pseudomonas phage Psa21]QBJ02689.1 hypothetical protein PSA21_162 [Pseudomonas phage Psa21]